MISPRSIPLKYTGWKNQHSQVSSKPGRCLHVTEETVRYFDSNKWLWLVMTAVKRSGTTEEYSAFVIRKDSEGVFLYIYFKEKEEGLFYEWNINDDHCHCCAWWSISSLWSLSVGHFLRTVQYMPVCFAPCSCVSFPFLEPFLSFFCTLGNTLILQSGEHIQCRTPYNS